MALRCNSRVSVDLAIRFTNAVRDYYISDRGESLGPYSHLQIKWMWDSKLINPETLYWTDGMEDWNLLSNLADTLDTDGMSDVDPMHSVSPSQQQPKSLENAILPVPDWLKKDLDQQREALEKKLPAELKKQRKAAKELLRKTCPHCGSQFTHFEEETAALGMGCLGFLLFRPLGLLTGFGLGSVCKSEILVCHQCGHRARL